jgi:FHA domain
MSAVDVKVLAQLARKQTRTEFAAMHRKLYLAVAESAEQLGPSFATVLLHASPAVTTAPGSHFDLLEISKAPGNPYPDRISIGRARNCDLVIRHSSVSKLHGHFRVAEDGGLELVDLGSPNGTAINGRCLLPNTPEWIEAGDMVLIGAVTGKIVDAETLYGMLQPQ